MCIGKKPLMVGLLLCLAGLGVAWALRQPLTSRLADWRVQKNLASYREAADTGDWDAAYRHALAAHQLNPRQLESLAALLQVGIDGKTGRVWKVAERMLHHPDASATDKAGAMEVFLHAGDAVLFDCMFQRLPDAEQRQPELMRVYAAHLAQVGRLHDAAAVYQSLLKMDPDAELALALAGVLARAAAAEAAAGTRAQGLIVELLKAPDRDLGLGALRLLQAIPPDQWRVEPILAAAAWAENHPGTSTSDHLLLHSMQIRADERQRDRILHQAVSRYGVEHAELVARWLGTLGEYDLALEVLDEEAGAKSPDAFMARARILHRAGRDAEAAAWLQAPHRGIPPAVVSTLRAVVAAPDQAARLWEKALQQAELEESADLFWRISRSAAVAGNQDIEMRAAVEALKRPGAHPRVAELGHVLTWLYGNDQSEDLLRVCRTLIHREPESPTLRNNLAYLEIVSGRLSDRAVTALEDLQREFPSVSQFATSRAVACVARGEYRVAREILESAVADWDQAPAPAMAAYAIALKSSNDGNSAAAPLFEWVRERVKWEQMLSVEQDFFQSRLDAAELSAAGVNPDPEQERQAQPDR